MKDRFINPINHEIQTLFEVVSHEPKWVQDLRPLDLNVFPKGAKVDDLFGFKDGRSIIIVQLQSMGINDQSHFYNIFEALRALRDYKCGGMDIRSRNDPLLLEEVKDISVESLKKLDDMVVHGRYHIEIVKRLFDLK